MRRKTSHVFVLPLLLMAATSVEGQRIELEIYCPVDVDMVHNGVIGAAELLVIADLYGECGAGGCLGDITGAYAPWDPGYVGENDLSIVVGHLGPCPCKGDVNGDGVITVDNDMEPSDLDLVVAAFGRDCRPDVNQNKWVDPLDLYIVQSTLAGSPDADRLRADVNDDEVVDERDADGVRFALGLDCRPDVDHDGEVDEDDETRLLELYKENPYCD